MIRLGKIDVHAKRKGTRQRNNTKVKTIANDLNKEVSNNSYGYTAILSNKPVRLEAIAAEHTSAYYIDK